MQANEDTNIHVLDVPGFSDSGSLAKVIGKKNSVNEGNLQIIRWLVREQIQSQLKVRCIVYFLPVRGPLEKTDGVLQEELKVLYHYFGEGEEVFDCVVVVATNPPKKKYQVNFDRSDFDETEEVLKAAMKEAIGKEEIECPPIIYIGLDDTPDVVLQKIKGASVLKDDILPLRFSIDVCASCSVKICCSKDDNHEKISVLCADGTSVPYMDSKCHPQYVQKFSTIPRRLLADLLTS